MIMSAAVVVALLAQVQGPAPPQRPPAGPAVQASAPTARGAQRVCHPGAGTGRIQGPPVCHTRDEWDAMVRTATAGMNRGGPNACRAGMMNGC